MGEGKQSKTNVTARFGRKEKVEAKPLVMDLRGERSSSTSVVAKFPQGFLKRQPETDDERRAVADFEASSKHLKTSNPKTSGSEAGYAGAFARMRRYGLVD